MNKGLREGGYEENPVHWISPFLPHRWLMATCLRCSPGPSLHWLPPGPSLFSFSSCLTARLRAFAWSGLGDKADRCSGADRVVAQWCPVCGRLLPRKCWKATSACWSVALGARACRDTSVLVIVPKGRQGVSTPQGRCNGLPKAQGTRQS